MLVLSRKKDQQIIIDDQISVEVVEIRGDKVLLGVRAPKVVSVHRGEVWEMIHGKQWQFVVDIAGPPSLN